MPTKLIQIFDEKVRQGAIQPDDAQRAAVARLNDLVVRLKGWKVPKGGLFGGLFSSKQPAPRGLYIHGKVGRGKTMLMDLFHDTVDFEPKWRVHFHAFMAEVHDRIGKARQRDPGDPIPAVAKELVEKARLLCFDEFHVTDIADAMILGRLFQAMFAEGVVIVATSNVPPDGLYRNGLNRQLFLPFIALIEQRMELMELASAKDFRLEKLAGERLYFTPDNDDSSAALRRIFERLTGVARGAKRSVEVKGRQIIIDEAAEGVAFVTFDDLCAKPLGALDYLAIAEGFHTIIMRGIPILVRDRRAEARRFITLVDTLYDQQICLIVSAEAEPDELHPAGDESFLFERTASRLIEMRSEAYLKGRRAVVPAESERQQV